MSVFASDRERRLWLWTLAVLVAIYATLGPARALAELLRAHNLLAVSFVLFVAVVVGALVLSWRKQRPGWREVGVALGVALAYLMVWARIESWEERTHLIEYGIVAALVHQALLERARHGRAVPKPALLAVVLTALLGALDEGIQSLIPSRVFDARDIFFNAFAGFLVVSARLALAPQQRTGWRVWFLWLMAAAYGWGLAVVLTGLGELSLRSGPAHLWDAYLGVAGAGVVVAVLQALVLRKKITGAGWWALTSLGTAVLYGAILFGVSQVDADLGWVVGTGLIGLCAGGLQGLVLRGQVRRAGWWVLASTVGWIVGMPIGQMVGWNGIGAMYGAITGGALVWLLRQPPHQAEPDAQTEPSIGRQT